MAQREGSVFVYLFVAVLVLVIALLASVLILKSDMDGLRTENKRVQGEYEAEQKRYREEVAEHNELKKLVTGDSDAFPDLQLLRDQLSQVETEMNEIRKQFELQDSTYTALIHPYKDYGEVLKKLKAAFDTQTLQAETALGDLARVRETTQGQLKEVDDAKDKLQTALSELERRFEDNDTQLRQRIEELTNQLAEQEELATRTELRLKKDLAFEGNRVQQLRNRIAQYEEKILVEKTVEDIEPDGQLIDVEPRSRAVWVNLGRRSHLRPGIVFRVFQYVKGRKQWKGSVEIRRVEDEFSEGRIVEELDSLNPISASDQVTSPFYDPKEAPEFVFAGTNVTNTKVTLEYIQKKLQSFGATIGDSVKIETDFLVALENYEATPEYRAARELGVTILRESDLIDYLGR